MADKGTFDTLSSLTVHAIISRSRCLSSKHLLIQPFSRLSALLQPFLQPVPKFLCIFPSVLGAHLKPALDLFLELDFLGTWQALLPIFTDSISVWSCQSGHRRCSAHYTLHFFFTIGLIFYVQLFGLDGLLSLVWASTNVQCLHLLFEHFVKFDFWSDNWRNFWFPWLSLSLCIHLFLLGAKSCLFFAIFELFFAFLGLFFPINQESDIPLVFPSIILFWHP